MKVEKAHIDRVRTAFAEMQSREDLLQLLNEVKPLIYGKNAHPFQMKQLTWYANSNLGGRRYVSFSINKKSGGHRKIHAPVSGLKALQKTLAYILQCVFEPHDAATGFVRNKSIVDNAKRHVNNRYVYNIDLKDFFSSIDQARVWKCLQLKPFNLYTNELTPEITFDVKFRLLETLSPTSGYRLSIRNDEKVFGIPYEGNLIAGYHTVEVPSGQIVHYKVEKKDNYSGQIIIFRKKSNLDAIESSVMETRKNREPNPTNLDSKVHLVTHLAACIQLHQNNIRNKTSKLQLANMIASLCCTEMSVERKNKDGEWEEVKRNVLPQGAPTSPVITNIVCQRLDYILTGVAKRFGLVYSRYADDITFSSLHNVYQKDGEFLKELHRIIAEQNFIVKDSKTRLQKDGYRKEVTGLIVNEKVNVHKRYIKQLRMWLYYWERYGFDKASVFFSQQYTTDKGHVKNEKPNMANVISGKLDYLRMVRGSNDDLYMKLNKRFKKLTKTSNSNKEKLPINHNPKALVSLLKNFSRNDSPLKYTTHSWDAGRDSGMFRDINEFLLLAKKQYDKFSNELRLLKNNLHGKIYAFIFRDDIANTGWGDDSKDKRIYFGWSSNELIENCKSDPSLNPADYILPEKYKIRRRGKTINKFKDVIDVFKNQIEIREENSALLDLIIQKHDTYLTSFNNPDYSNLDNISFYTDVQWLNKAIDRIFEGISKVPEHPNVEYRMVSSNPECFVLNIIHKDSFKETLSYEDEKFGINSGDFGDIMNYLENLCDWSIESKFKEGCYRINYLSSDKNIPHFEKIDSTEGFKHILTFYK